jgi:hypothetical protein
MTKTFFFAALPLILSLTISAPSQALPEAGRRAIKGIDHFVGPDVQVHGKNRSTAPRFPAVPSRERVDDPFTSMHLD